jgi:dihydroxyacetone kinase
MDQRLAPSLIERKSPNRRGGRYATSMEMAGMSLTLCVLDDELEQLLKAPASCPFWGV